LKTDQPTHFCNHDAGHPVARRLVGYPYWCRHLLTIGIVGIDPLCSTYQ
jgi:hypothetical protein